MEADLPQATNIVVDLRTNYHIFCSIVTWPVVPKGIVMFRIIPTAAHTMEDVQYTLDAFADVRKKLQAGAYKSDTIQDMAIK